MSEKNRVKMHLANVNPGCLQIGPYRMMDTSNRILRINKMSSSYIVEPQESGSKKDDTLIIVVNDDGTISVDQDTLQNLIMNQSNANVSVVRLGQTEGDTGNGDITLTVDPPTFSQPESSTSTSNAVTTDSSGLVDPFMEMDPEQLERLETALQSEEAKQILGENVTAMLDMLTVEEQQNSLKHSIELDHCYTSCLSPSDPKPNDPLPVAHSPDINDMQFMHTTSSQPPLESVSTTVKPKTITKVVKAPGRPRKDAKTSISHIAGTPKSTGNTIPRNMLNLVQQGSNKATARTNDGAVDEDDLSDSSEESSEFEQPSDNDSDFGPRGPRRGGGSGLRARGGRKGLTTRGGSMTATRRRGPNKHMDIEQVRRLDMEMAAAVDAMKSPEKDDKSEKFSPLKTKKQLKTLSRKKEDASLHGVNTTESSEVYEKPLQTTNQVKANLINANMIKGDMILTKPGQAKNNHKMMFLQKQVVMKGGEIKNVAGKKQLVVSKNTLNQVNSKITTTMKDGKLMAVSMASKTSAQGAPKIASPQIPTQQQQQLQSQQLAQQPQKIVAATVPAKIKPELKKEKKKSESSTESLPKIDVDLVKLAEPKTPDSAKKHQKKEHRKSPAHLDALGPALFSTPDIIRRVGSGGESKVPDSPLTPTTPTSSIGFVSTANSSINVSTAQMTAMLSEHKVGVVGSLDDSLLSDSQMETEDHSVGQTGSDEQKSEMKAPLAEELQSSLDPGGIEGEEHLLATLEMEANKHEEELLAEALLLQEELGVDLADHPLVDQTPTVAEPLLPAPTLVPPAIITQDQEQVKKQDILSIAATPSMAAEPGKRSTKDEKEPIQIVRGGRVITLPPIEAPATRSKRLQAKNESPQKKPEVLKKNDKYTKQMLLHHQELQLHQQQLQAEKEEMESEMDEDDEEEDNSDSEDDPDRLWCICKRPHNNRFMICCDVCEDWFHGKCVHVSKAMGQQMEEKGIEWVCPNCTKKKAEETKAKSVPQPVTPKQHKAPELSVKQSVVQQNLSSPSTQTTSYISASLPSTQNSAPFAGVTQCVVCKKEARNSSIYCSDACILTHAQESLTKDKPDKPDKPPVPVSTAKTLKLPTSSDSPKTKSDPRVIVFERRTGKVLTGLDAPTTSNLKTWLKENPTFEVVRPNNLNTLQIGGKSVTAIQTQGMTKIGKSVSQAGGKTQGNPKMVYTKVFGSKQTVLAPSHKKLLVTSGAQQQQTNSSPQTKTVQSKQTLITASLKPVSVTAKQQTSGKTMVQQSRSQAVASPKPTLSKKQEPKASTSQQKLPMKSPVAKKSEPEPIRINIRKTLTELLSSRIKETHDLKLTDEEIGELALNIELELYKFFKDTGAKYKAKYRSLVFNIKDTKNLTLFRKIADRSLTPDAVVRLSPDEMASQELAEWREKETKHQLEMIKKNELDLMAQAKSIVVKTHKGEQIIENDGGIDHVDPKTPVQDIVTALNSGENITSTIEDDKDKDDNLKSKDDMKKLKNGEDKKKKDKDRNKDKQERSQSRSRRHRSREREHSKTRERSRDRRSTRNKESKRDKDKDRERDKEREKEKDRERDKDKDKEREKKDKVKYKKSKSNTSSTRSRAGHRDSTNKEKDKKEDDRKKEAEKKKEPTPPPVDKPIEDRLWRHIEEETTTNTLDGNESDVSDREPSSTVNIKTPDINEEPEREKDPELEKDIPRGPLQTVWRGFVNMVDVAKFFITAQEISGHARDLMEDLPDTVDVVGRISHETVWDYISKMKKTGSKEILVIRLTAANDEEKIPYITLYSYLNSRSRLGVVGNVSKNIKDFYIMPFSNQSSIPQVLLPLDGPGFEEQRPHLLLGIIVRNKRKRVAAIPPVVPAKVSKKEPDRSYTPPLVNIPKEKSSTTPPSSPKVHKSSTLDVIKEKQPVTQMTLETLNKAQVGMSRSIIDTATISKIVPELSSKLDLTSSPKATLEDDGDEPYSPGDIDDDNVNEGLPVVVDPAVNILSPTKNSTELQRKMDELNRQIEEQKQQIQNISSSFLGETTTATLPGLGLDPPESNDGDEAYSPSDTRSFTPPPPAGISKFTQPILDKVSDITIPPNLQEILANVKRQEITKVDPYLPSKPSATFLTSVKSSIYQKSEKYPSIYPKTPSATSRLSSDKQQQPSFESQPTASKESKSTLRSLSDLDLIKKAEEELAAVAAASTITPDLTKPPPPLPSPSVAAIVPPVIHVPPPSVLISTPPPTITPLTKTFTPMVDSAEKTTAYQPSTVDPFKKVFVSEQPKPPGLEDEEFPAFPSTPPTLESSLKTPPSKFVPKSGIVLSVKRKNDDNVAAVPTKTARTKSRWGQGPSE
ncbi:death-inducer obliterator 1 isoform X2 [Cephus cinctus]|uniref:Death-inducer obliterator 1 isoform X2 n=1 Tax=Cephus cinctus TaxID=211228 RepID=A0AAJ7RFR1_CEPCN|nr:death-inducer obliterator 1 isoform X2 [Cephus cinctus]